MNALVVGECLGIHGLGIHLVAIMWCYVVFLVLPLLACTACGDSNCVFRVWVVVVQSRAWICCLIWRYCMPWLSRM